MWIPDPRFEMPELLIPGKKPTGLTIVDKTHKLAPDVCLLPMHGQSTVYDAANNKVNSVTDADGFNVTPKGTALYFNQSAYVDVDEITGAGIISWYHFRAYINSLASFRTLISIDAHYEIYTQSNNLLQMWDKNATTTLCSSISTGYADIFIRLDDTDQSVLWTAQGWYNGSTGEPSSPTYHSFTPGQSRIGANSSGAEDVQMDLISFAYWKGDKLANFREEVTRNPYQYLIPV